MESGVVSRQEDRRATGSLQRTLLGSGGGSAQFRADIIVLQGGRNDDAAERLGKLMPGFTIHGTSRFKDSFTHTIGEQQITIMSRFKADGSWAESWKRSWPKVPRGFGYAKLLVSGKAAHRFHGACDEQPDDSEQGGEGGRNA